MLRQSIVHVNDFYRCRSVYINVLARWQAKKSFFDMFQFCMSEMSLQNTLKAGTQAKRMWKQNHETNFWTQSDDIGGVEKASEFAPFT